MHRQGHVERNAPTLSTVRADIAERRDARSSEPSMTTSMTTSIGTFATSRRELTGPDTLLGVAESARQRCRGVERRLSLLSVTRTQMRRVDVWIDTDSIVTHAAAPDPDQPVVGSISPRSSADSLIGSLVESLVGRLPRAAASTAVEIPVAGAVAPGSAFPDVDWLLVLTAATASDTGRLMLAARADGLVGAGGDDVGAPVRLEPMPGLQAWIAVGELIGPTGRAGTDRPPEMSQSRP